MVVIGVVNLIMLSFINWLLFNCVLVRVMVILFCDLINCVEVDDLERDIKIILVLLVLWVKFICVIWFCDDKLWCCCGLRRCCCVVRVRLLKREYRYRVKVIIVS